MLLRKALLPALLTTVFLTTVATIDYCSLPSSLSRFGAVTLQPLSNPDMKAAYRSIAGGAHKFGLEFWAQISDLLERDKLKTNFMISPFSVWALLLLLVEAAADNTLQELRTTLHIETEQQVLRAAFSDIQKFLLIDTPTVDVRNLQAMFVDAYEQFQETYRRTLTDCYGASIYQLPFNASTTANFINEKISKATRGLIPDAFDGDLSNARMLLTSTLYFKGQWKLPFNKTDTRREPFYDEHGVPTGEVDMMFQMTPFNYTSMNELEGHVLELPYGNEDRLCMLLILPKKGVSLNRIVHNLKNVGVTAIFDKIAADSVGYDDEEVEVYLPKFTTTTKFLLRGTLEAMGIKDIFDPQHVEFSNISNNLYVKDIMHNTKIIVNEEGTEAAAVTIALLANKASPPKFYFNRPFLYMIAEKRTGVLLFAGQVVNPNFL